MSYQVFTPFLQLREFDDSGLLLANGTMEFYRAGTSDWGNIYADSIGTPAPNPVQLDGAGTARIFGDPVAYKLIIKDSTGAEIFEIDNVFPFGQGSGGTSGLGTVAIVANYAGLRSLTQDFDAVIVCGYAVAGDGAGGLFFRSPGNQFDNNGTYLQRAASTTYARAYSGWIDPRWFGVAYSTPVDQMDALESAALVGPVQVAGRIYQGRDFHFTHVYSFIPGGGLYTGSGLTPKAYFDTGAKIREGAPAMFGEGIAVFLGQQVTDEIHSSWFHDLAQAMCSEWNYRFVVDEDVTLATSPVFPDNFAVDFTGGAKLKAIGAQYSVTIKNLIYQGAGQIVSYDTLAHVGAVDLAGLPALLEWFGGQAGYTFGINNAIPGKAALSSGSIRLLEGKSYVIPSDGTTWTTGKDLILAGVTGAETLQLDQSVTVGEFRQRDCVLTGAGTFTASGVADLKDCSILGGVARTGANSQDAAAAVFVPALLFAAGSGGAAETSADGSTWSAVSGITETISGPIAQGPIRIAAGQAHAWKSADGGQTWSSSVVPGLSTVWGAWYLNGLYIVAGNGGISYSSDAVTWNHTSIFGASQVYGIAWHAGTSRYVAVGITGIGPGAWTSADLITWTARPLPSGLSASFQLLTVCAGPDASLVVAGIMSGTILTSADGGVTWAQQSLPASDTIYASAASADAIILTGSTGSVFRSTTAGATWTKLLVGSGPILSATWNAGTFLLGASLGVTYQSTNDGVTWLAGYVGNNANVSAVSLTPPVYAIGGVAGSLQISMDFSAADWQSVAVPGLTADITNIRVLAGLAYITAKGGNLYATSDFLSFRLIPTGVTSDLYDIAYNSTAHSWSIVGATGYIATTADIRVNSPAWVTPPGYSPIGDTLTRIAWISTNGYTVASAANILRSTDLTASVTENTWSIFGMVYDGTTYIQYGSGGTILTASDPVAGPWTLRTSPSAANIFCGIAQGGSVVLGCAGGVILRSTDHGASWSSISSAISQNINSIAWNAGTSKLGLCTSSAGVYQSADLGLTWSSINTGGITGAPDLLSIWARASEWNVCGAAGTWAFTTATTWTMRTTAVTVQLNEGEGDICVGASGTILSVNTGSLANYTTNLGISANLVHIKNKVVLDSTGKAWIISTSGATGGPADLMDSACVNLCADSLAVYAVGANVWKSLATSGYYTWSKIIAKPVGLLDLASISGVLYASGSAGYFASSANGLIWQWAGAKYDTTDHYSAAFYRYGELSLGIAGVRAFAQGTGAVVLAGVGGLVQSGSNFLAPVFSALRVDADAVTASVDLGSTNPGTIKGSALRSVSAIGQASDTTFSRFHGSISGNLTRVTMVQAATVTISGDLRLIAESSMTKTDAMDPTHSPLVSFAGSRLQIDATALEFNGGLIYSESTGTTVVLNGCLNSAGFASDLSNGYAKIQILTGDKVKNTQLTSINAVSVNPISTDSSMAPLIASSDILANWRNTPAGTTQVGDLLITGADMAIGGGVASPNTIRYYGFAAGAYNPGGIYDQMQAIHERGGIIDAEFILPSGKSMGRGLKVGVVFPGQYVKVGGGAGPAVNLGVNFNYVSYGESAPGVAVPVAGKEKARAYVWAGTTTWIVQNSGENLWHDVWDDYTFHLVGGGGQWVNVVAIVIYSDESVVIPAGTSIKLTATHCVPSGRAEYDAFFPETKQRNLDYLDYRDRSDLYMYEHDQSFLDANVNGINVKTAWLPDFPVHSKKIPTGVI